MNCGLKRWRVQRLELTARADRDTVRRATSLTSGRFGHQSAASGGRR